jgi:hypothetical protein
MTSRSSENQGYPDIDPLREMRSWAILLLFLSPADGKPHQNDKTDDHEAPAAFRAAPHSPGEDGVEMTCHGQLRKTRKTRFPQAAHSTWKTLRVFHSPTPTTTATTGERKRKEEEKNQRSSPTLSGRLEHHENSPEKTGRIVVVDRE